MPTTLAPKSFAQLFTATGGANGTVVDATGKIVVQAAPAINHNPVSKVPLGLRLRGLDKTNLFKYSADLTQLSVWNAGGTSAPTRVPNVYMAPDGTMSGDEVINQGGNSHIAQTLADSTQNSVYSVVFRIRAGTSTTAAFGLYNNAWPAQTCTILSGPGSVSSAAYCTITGLTAAWTTVQVTLNAPIAAGQQLRFLVYPETTSGGTAGRSVGLWGLEAYQGTPSTTYIPTAAAAVTRTVERITIANLHQQPWWNPAEGTILVDFDVAATSAGLVQSTPRILHISSGNNAIQLWQSPTNKIGARFDVNGTVTWNVEVAPFAFDAALRGVVSWKAGRQVVRVNEAIRTLAAAAPNLSSGVTFRLGHASADAFDGHIHRITYWPKAANEAEIATLNPDTELITG